MNFIRSVVTARVGYNQIRRDIMININYDQAKKEAVLNKEFGQRELVVDGEYEAKIVKVDKRQANSGTGLISIQFEIRKDFMQSHQGAIIEDNLWADKGTTNFNTDKLIDLAIGVGIESGMQFSSLDGFNAALIGRNVKIKVKVVTEKGQDGNEYKKSLIVNKKPSTLGMTTTFNTDDVPF